MSSAAVRLLRLLVCCRAVETGWYDEVMAALLIAPIAMMTAVFTVAIAETVAITLPVAVAVAMMIRSPMSIGVDIAAAIAKVDDYAGAVVVVCLSRPVSYRGRRSQSCAQYQGEELRTMRSHNILRVGAEA